MSRYKNIITGERYMTEQNALRYYISKAYKVKKRQNYEEMRKLWTDSTKVIDVDWCFRCIQDDFGYCGLRRGKMSEKERFMKYCFEGWIRNMEQDLAELQGKECSF